MNFGNIVGQTLDGKYKIERELGKGGMGAVYLSTHIGTERPVAVKVIVPEFMKRAEFVERFRREARAAGRLRHPNVVDVTDFGIADTEFGQVAYLVMEYLDGCTLGEILEEEQNLPVGWTLDILEQVCSAVHEAHTQGIIHRDLKPDNIWLEPNQRGGYTVKVLDFGIAKLEENLNDSIAENIAPETGFAQKNHPARVTLADFDGTDTIADGDGSTAVSESRTVIQTDEPKTLVSEAGTLIQNVEAESDERQTAILDTPKEFAGTRLMAAAQKTDKSKEKKLSTGKTSLEEKLTKELTRVGAVLGTPLYMSPEQCRGERLDARSDIYSLGVIIYQMLSGKMPFPGNFNEVMQAHQDAPPPPLDAQKVPRKLENIVMQSLAKDTGERPQTAEAFASKLRASSEGIGSLLTRALVIYSQRLPKFLLLAIIVSLPALVLTFGRIAFSFSRAFGLLTDGALVGVVAAISGIATFFVQIFTAAILVGVTTWIVAQILAVPLRPISLRTALRKVKQRWKPLLITVTISTILAMISWGVGFLGGVLGSAVISGSIYLLTGNQIFPISIAFIFGASASVFLGVLVSAVFMLVAPAIMMEEISGRRAFRRSVELTRRSLRTVIAAALLAYFIPGVLGLMIAFAIGGIISNPKLNLGQFANSPAETAVRSKDSETVTFGMSKPGIQITTGETDKEDEKADPAATMKTALTEGIFELLWSPIAILISSFTSIITALIYFKTRQAGGETMLDLLRRFEDADKPKSRWQKQIQEKFVQSGRISSQT